MLSPSSTLSFQSSPLYLGGLPDVSAHLSRLDQVKSVDFVGCVKSLSLDGLEKDILAQSVNSSGIQDTCNRVEGGACTRGDECGEQGQFVQVLHKDTQVHLRTILTD